MHPSLTRTRTDANEPTSRNRLSSIAANHWRPQSGTANPPDHPRKKILLVEWRQNGTIPPACETRAACHCMARGGYPRLDCIGMTGGDDGKEKRPADRSQSYHPPPHPCGNRAACPVGCAAREAGRLADPSWRAEPCLTATKSMQHLALKKSYSLPHRPPGYYVLSPREDEHGHICEAYRDPVIAWALSETGCSYPVTLDDGLDQKGDPPFLCPDGLVRSYSQSWPDLAAWLDDQKAKVRHGKLR